MATTTNFGWETPDDTDLVKDGAAAIRTALGGVDTSFVDLKGGTTGQVLAKASATDLDFSWVAVDPLTILDAKGDLITATAADTPARLAVGTNGQTLVADSSTATGLKWAAPAGGGKVLQVVFGSTSSGTSSNSTTFATTNLTATITPTLNTSKVLVLLSQNGCVKTTNNISMYLRLVRGATTLANLERNGGNTNSTATNGFGSISTAYLDTPATTSATTYLTEFAVSVANNQVTVQDSGGGVNALSTIILMEIGA